MLEHRHILGAPGGATRCWRTGGTLAGVQEVLDQILARRPAHPLRVAIDGPDAAGKTTLADRLAARLAGQRPTVRVSIDGFHHPRQRRYRRGALSPDGYLHDAFDFEAVREWVLRPLGPGGDRWYRPAIFDHRTDTALDLPARRAAAGAVLLFDGVFLQHPELRDYWDLRVFVDVRPEVALRRALTRDAALLGGADAVRQRYRLRYLPGQQRYREQCAPLQRADIVIDTSDGG